MILLQLPETNPGNFCCVRPTGAYYLPAFAFCFRDLVLGGLGASPGHKNATYNIA